MTWDIFFRALIIALTPFAYFFVTRSIPGWPGGASFSEIIAISIGFVFGFWAGRVR